MIPRAADIETRLLELFGDGAVYHTRQVTQELADHFKLTPHELAESDGSHPRFAHKVHSALAKHRSRGLLVRLKYAILPPCAGKSGKNINRVTTRRRFVTRKDRTSKRRLQKQSAV